MRTLVVKGNLRLNRVRRVCSDLPYLRERFSEFRRMRRVGMRTAEDGCYVTVTVVPELAPPSTLITR